MLRTGGWIDKELNRRWEGGENVKVKTNVKAGMGAYIIHVG